MTRVLARRGQVPWSPPSVNRPGLIGELPEAESQGALESQVAGVGVSVEVWVVKRSRPWSQVLGQAVILKSMRTLAVLLLTGMALTFASVAGAKIPPLYKNCTALDKKYPHGLGRVHAHDKTSGTPVTSFLRSDRLYRLANSYNKGLDRDHDGIACEKA